MKKTNQNQPARKGFSLLETMVTMSLFFIILAGVYTMIEHYGNVTKNEHSRMRLQQESRFMASTFADELKEAGAVLTLAHTGGFLGAAPFFNGIFPLNSTNFPDGVIIATGDPEAVTSLTMDYDAGGDTLNVENLNVAAHDATHPWITPQWSAGDKGVLLGTNGYYVFSVSAVDISGKTITMRDTAVYYSGLLAIPGYYSDSSAPGGNTVDFAKNTPVIRLDNFGIFVFREIPYPHLEGQVTRQLIRITDTKGQANPLADNSGSEFSVISENIWDMQISYLAYSDFPSATRSTAPEADHYYFAGTGSTGVLSNLLDDIRNKRLKQMNVGIVAIMDDLAGKGTLSAIEDAKPIGDRASNDLPGRKLNFKLFTFSVEPRNFNIIL